MTKNVQKPTWFANYQSGVPEDLDPVTGSVYDIIAQAAHDAPEVPAVDFFGHTKTYREIKDEVDRVAGGLADLGVKKGDHVALILPNCPQHVVAFYAVARLGAVVIEHNPLYTSEELEHLFEDHRADIVIAWDMVIDNIQAFPKDVRPSKIIAVDLIKAMPRVKQVALHLPIPQMRKTKHQIHKSVHRAISWERVLKAAPIRDGYPGAEIGDLAVIQYTSGTTGKAKGVQLSHRNVKSNAAQCSVWGPEVPRGEGAAVFGVLPMFHAYGLTLCATVASSLRARLVLFPKFDPDQVIDAHLKTPATLFPLVPPIADRLLKRAAERDVSLKGIQVAISGAMPLPSELVEPWEKATGGMLVEGYGLSECSPILLINPFTDKRVSGAAGLPVSSTLARLVDPENPTEEVAKGERGELVVKGPQVFGGYYKMPEESKAAFADGWFRTGDIATIDKGGYVRIVDRIKELIITGGFNVMPSQVEASVVEIDGIAAAAVVGLPDKHSGEEVVAAIVPEEGADLDLEAIQHQLRDSMAAYKCPRRLFVFDELPVSQIGKVLRREVRDEILARLEGTD